MTLEKELALAVALAVDAGRAVMEVYATDFTVDSKGANDPVTEADRRANTIIVDGLRARFPNDAIVAEESLDEVAPRPRTWFVDPLDGTKEFIAKNGEFSVMIGLAIDGSSKLGVVYQPSTARLFTGAEGVALVTDRGAARPLRVSAVSNPSELRLVVSRSHRSAATDRVRAALGITSEKPSGSVGLKVGLLATRDADLYVHLSDKSHTWDACAPEAILVAAGGRFTGLDGEPLVYGVGESRNRRGILACNAAAFDAVLPAVRRVAAEEGF